MIVYRESNGHVVRALTIAGSDSGGGAGIQADLKTLHQFDVYGMSVVTALTAQNTRGVQSIYDVLPEFVGHQLRSVADDFGMDAVKTGMLSSTAVICEVADILSTRLEAPLVVDPVMVAKGGASLLQSTAVEALKYRLLPLATVATPNLPEAEVICGYPLTTWRDCLQAARDIAELGVKFVVIKGGHTLATDTRQSGPEAAVDVYQTEAYATDIVYVADRDEFTYLVTPRINSQKTHGTGCTYSAALTALLARGVDPLTAITGAKAFVYHAIERARTWDVGHGHGPTDHSSPIIENYTPHSGQFNVYRQSRWTVV